MILLDLNDYYGNKCSVVGDNFHIYNYVLFKACKHLPAVTLADHCGDGSIERRKERFMFSTVSQGIRGLSGPIS